MLEGVFRQITTDAIDAVADKGECDFVESIAVPLPLLLIAEMLGIRKEDRERFHQWSDFMIAGDGNMDKPEIMAKAAMAFVEYSTYLRDVIEDRRHNPKEDLISILVHAKDDGILGQFDENLHVSDVTGVDHAGFATDELVMLCTILLVAATRRHATASPVACSS